MQAELSSESVEQLDVNAESAYQHFKDKTVEIGQSGIILFCFWNMHSLQLFVCWSIAWSGIVPSFRLLK